MFWKRPKIRAALSLLAAVLLSCGLALISGYGRAQKPAPSTTAAFSTVVYETWQEYTAFTQIDAAGAFTSSVSPEIRPYLAAILLGLGCILALLLLFTSSMAKPRFGVDLCLCCLGSLWFPLPFLLQFPLLWLCILSLEELLAWVRARFPWDWWDAHRAGRALGIQWYALTQGLWCVFFLALGFVLAFLFPAAMPLAAVFAASAIAALYSLARFGRDLEQLLRQIDAISQGESPASPVRTIFANSQQQLQNMHLAQEQAIAAAVTSERFKVELIANVSHDLRTPLTAILGYGELLEKQPMPPAAAEELRKLNGKAAYMKDLVDSLFELTKVSSGAETAKQEPIDLIRLLEQTLGLFQDLFQEAGLQIRRHYCSDSIPLLTDGARLHQVFANLLGNAVKYAQPGSRVHLHVDEQDTSVTLRLTNVSRYEMDFAPEDILQRFARGDQARSTPGSGLGLAIAQTYTASLGGSFSVAIDGEQFTAIVTLPKPERNL